MCALLFVTLPFFLCAEKPWKISLGLSCGKEQIFQPWTRHRYHSLRTVWEYNNFLTYNTKKGKQKCLADLENTASYEDESPEEDQPAEIAKQLLNPTCQPPFLVLSQSPNFTLLSYPMLLPPENIFGKPVATDWWRHFGFAIMNHFLSDVHILSTIGKKTFQI